MSFNNINLTAVANHPKSIVYTLKQPTVSSVQIYDDHFAITGNYNGHWTYDNAIIYNAEGLNYNDADKSVRNVNNTIQYYERYDFKATSDMEGSAYIKTKDIPFAAYIQFPICTNVFYESKRFKNNPISVVYPTRIDKDNEEIRFEL